MTTSATAAASFVNGLQELPGARYRHSSMSELDKPEDKIHVGPIVQNPKAIEGVHESFLMDGLLEARRRTWEAFDRIREKLEVGMTEPDARKMARRLLTSLGSTHDWHKPYLRFGAGTALTFHDATQREYRLAEGDAVYIDLGPVWPSTVDGLEYEGDVGATFAFGENAEVQACADTAKRLFDETCAAWRAGNLSGRDLYQFLVNRTAESGYVLDPRVEGHRVADYPHSRFAKTHLARVPFAPAPHLWVLEVQIAHKNGQFGAFYEDILQ